MAVSLFPWVGEVYYIWTLVLWKDPITWEELWPLSKTFTIIWLLSWLCQVPLLLDTVSLDIYQESLELANNMPGIVDQFDTYYKAYYTSYIVTYSWLSIVPVGKLKYIKGTIPDSPDLKKVKEWNQTYKRGWVPVHNPKIKVEGKIDHIVKIDFKPDWTFSGVHSRKAIHDYSNQNWVGSAWFDDLDEVNTDWNQPYRAKVYAKNTNGDTVLKTWWNWYSSVFPDSWSQQKIIDEVIYSIENNIGLADINATWSARNILRWPTRLEWIDIDFVYVNWELKTFYPVIK